MKGTYIEIKQKDFLREMYRILKEEELGYMDDFTDKWIKAGNITMERIYKISLNDFVWVFIWSSIDIRSESVRYKGTDAIRVVLRWRHPSGKYLWLAIGKNYRTEGLFKNNNLRKTLKKAQTKADNPWIYNFNEHWWEALDQCK